MNYKFIIAHYNENLDWIKKEAKNTYIYHKGNEIKPRFDCFHWEKLPNVGREGHTYLYHIIKNYHDLADINIFLQGDIRDHTTGKNGEFNIEKYYSTLRHSDVGFYSYREIDGIIFTKYMKKRMVFRGKFKDNFENNKMRHAKLEFPDFLKKYSYRRLPLLIPFFHGACFSVKKELIEQHPITFYQNLMTNIDDHPDPEEGHYLERMWLFIFNTSYKIPSKPKILVYFIKIFILNIPYVMKSYSFFKKLIQK